jgi:hypothetical protein
MFQNADSFDLAQRAGKMYAASDMVPDAFKGNVANCTIALDMALRLRASPFAVMQNLHIIHGRPSWSSTWLISMVNASGRYSPLQYRMTGKGDTRTCVAWAKHLQTGDVVEGPEVSIDIAKKEGWYQKNGSKWQTLPELMLRYRSAAFFCRLYCPDLCLGMRTEEEEQDIHSTRTRARGKVPIFTPAQSEPVPGTVLAETVVIEAEVTTPADPRAMALSDVLTLVTESNAAPAAIETVLRGRGVLGETGTIPRLGETKLRDIAGDFAAIEAEALAPNGEPPTNEEPEPEPSPASNTTNQVTL